MRAGLQGVAVTVFVFAMALLLAIGLLTYQSTISQTRTADWVAHTHGVLEGLDELLGSLVAAETAWHGYVITGDERALEPYRSGLGLIDSSLRTLKHLTADNPRQQARLQALPALVEREMSILRESIDLRRTHGFEIERQIALTFSEKAAMDELRREILDMQEGERTLLAHREDESRRSASRTRTITIAGTLVAITFLLVVFHQLALEVGKRRRAEEGIRRELTERKRVEEERDRYFTLSSDLICASGRDGFFKELNTAWEKTLGWSLQELIARPYLEFVHAEDRETTISKAADVFGGTATTQFENRFLCKDGSYRWLSWTCAGATQSAEIVYAVARDVSERKFLNEELRRRIAEADVANKELEAFSYSVSHDLRAPLRHVGGFVDLLLEHAGATLDSVARRYLDKISDSATKMGRLIDDLLAFSRMGRTEMRSTTVRLDRLVEQVFQELQHEADGRRVEWRIGPLPVVSGDPDMLRLVLVNLVSNALKYTRPCSEALIEITEVDRENDDAVIVVRDNGVGFDPQYAHKLFGVFQRLHRAEEFEGTGIGLANVRRIVLRHGGRTWAEAEEGRGAAFYVSLPRAPKDAMVPEEVIR